MVKTSSSLRIRSSSSSYSLYFFKNPFTNLLFIAGLFVAIMAVIYLIKLFPLSCLGGCANRDTDSDTSSSSDCERRESETSYSSEDSSADVDR